MWFCACVRVQKQQDTCSEMGDRRSDYVSCAAPQSLPTAVRAEKGSETLVHERCIVDWNGVICRKAFQCSDISVHFSHLIENAGKTTRQPFNRSINGISATEISPTQMGIALFRDFDKSVKKRSSFEKSQRFQRDASLGAVNMFQMFKRDVTLGAVNMFKMFK